MKSSYRILRVVSDYPVGGKPTYGLQPNFYYLSHEQVKLGNEVYVISRKHYGQPSYEDDGEIKIHRVDNPFNLNSYRVIQELMRKESVEARLPLIHTHSTSGFFLGTMKRPLGLPLFAHIHGASRSSRMPQRLKEQVDHDFSQTKMWYYFFREKMFWSSADKVLSVSDALKRDLIRCYDIPDRKISVVYNGVDTSLFRREPKLKVPKDLEQFQGKDIILYVGHFGPRKGLVYLIRAMKYIIEAMPSAVAVAVGGIPAWLGKKDYWSVLNSEIDANGMKGKILLLDRVPNETLPQFYSRADAFVLPSFYEAFAKVVLEAMACEVPIVITKEGGPREAIEDGKTGLLVNYGSEKQLANAIISLLQDKKKARQMGTLARQRVEKEFTWEAVAKRVNSAYDEVIRER